MNFKMDCTQIFSRIVLVDGVKKVVDEIWFQPSVDETQFFQGSDSRTIIYLERSAHSFMMGETYTLSLNTITA